MAETAMKCGPCGIGELHRGVSATHHARWAAALIKRLPLYILAADRVSLPAPADLFRIWRRGARPVRAVGRRLDDARPDLPLPSVRNFRARLCSRRETGGARAGICPGAMRAGAEPTRPRRPEPRGRRDAGRAGCMRERTRSSRQTARPAPSTYQPGRIASEKSKTVDSTVIGETLYQSAMPMASPRKVSSATTMVIANRTSVEGSRTPPRDQPIAPSASRTIR